jgi:hypothetical protein
MTTVRRVTWDLLTTVPNAPLALALVDYLTAEGVVSKVVSDTTLLGEGRACRVFVDVTQIHRARWLQAQANFSDEELTFLATRSLAPDEPEQ